MTVPERRRDLREDLPDPHVQARQRAQWSSPASASTPASTSTGTATALVCGDDVAVTLAYRPQDTSMPQVVARALGFAALVAADRAHRDGVHVSRDAALAHTLAGCAPGTAIPASLHPRVARLLAAAYSRRA